MKCKLFFPVFWLCVILNLNAFCQIWHQHRNGIPPEYMYGGSTTTVMGDGSNIFAAHISGYSDSGIFYAPNSSALFTPGICIKSNTHSVAQFARYAGKIFLGLANGVHASSDAGHTWPFISTQPSANPFITFLYASHDTLYAGVRGQGIYRTIDSAVSWSHLGNTGLDTEIIAMIRINGIIFSAGRYNLQYSMDEGVSWHTVPPTPEMTGAWYPDRIINYDTSIFVATGYGLYRSDDYGMHWVRKYSYSAGSMAVIDSYLLMATAAPSIPIKVKISKDRGETFVDMSTGLYINISSQIVNFSYNDSDVMLGIGSGCSCVDSSIYTMRRSDLAAAYSTAVRDPKPGLGKLWSIFPNPAADKFSVSTAVPVSSLSVQICDLSGRILRSLSFKNVQSLDVSVSDLAKGVYLLRINDGTDISTHKLVVSR
jgi:hypothetical protein